MHSLSVFLFGCLFGAASMAIVGGVCGSLSRRWVRWLDEVPPATESDHRGTWKTTTTICRRVPANRNERN